MKTFLLAAVCFLLATLGVAQQKPVKIVFDVTSADPAVHQSAIRHVSLMSEAYPGSEFEVVVYGNGIGMIQSDQSTVTADITKLVANPKVKFAVCQITMDKFKVSQKQLINGVMPVPDGILEIYTRQQEGWGYIKEGN